MVNEIFNVVGYWVIGITSLNVYKISYDINDKALVGYTLDDVSWYTLSYVEDDAYITLGDTNYFFSDCIRVSESDS